MDLYDTFFLLTRSKKYDTFLYFVVPEIWNTSVRVDANEEGIIERDEFERCIKIVMEEGEQREELRKNAKKWKKLANYCNCFCLVFHNPGINTSLFDLFYVTLISV